jgi:hypothetical protein
MKRPLLAFALIAVTAAVLAAAGCGTRKNTLGPDLPPETSVYIQGPIDTVSHRVHLYWFGSDPDGDVVAYQMRFVPRMGNPNPQWETVYCGRPGRCTDSVFTLFTGDSALIHSQFEIRAMDDKGQVDPTPAIQRFVLSNLAPRVHITNPLRVVDSSYASVTVAWEVDDPDGGGPGLRYRLWLNGNEAGYDSTIENLFTVPSPRFLEGGTYKSGLRTLYLQAVDDGGRSGPLDSTTWFVRAPSPVLDPVTKRGRLLIIDDSRRTNDNLNDFGVDTLYANVVARAASANPYNEPPPNNTRYVVLPPGTSSTLRLENSNPFRSVHDLMQTFRLFDAVVWYRGYEVNVSTSLQTYQDSIGAFILDGGRLYLEGLYLIEGHNSFGTLREDFVTRYLNCLRLLQQFDPVALDSTVGIGVQTSANLHSPMYADTVIRLIRPSGAPGSSPGLRAFVPIDAGQVAVTADTLALSAPTNHEPLPFAMSVNRFPGRLILIPFPVRALPPSGSSRALFPSFRMLSRLLFDKTNGLLAP